MNNYMQQIKLNAKVKALKARHTELCKSIDGWKRKGMDEKDVRAALDEMREIVNKIRKAVKYARAR